MAISIKNTSLERGGGAKTEKDWEGGGGGGGKFGECAPGL